jgi:hypothetical protein
MNSLTINEMQQTPKKSNHLVRKYLTQIQNWDLKGK